MLPQEQSPGGDTGWASYDSTVYTQPSLETLQYYYDLIDSDEAVYWALKDEFKDNLKYPRTYLVRLKPKREGPRKGEGRPKEYFCLAPSCDSIFTRKADLERHFATTHISSVRFDCPMYRCHRTGEDGFTREDHLKEHLRNYHRKYIPKGKGAG